MASEIKDLELTWHAMSRIVTPMPRGPTASTRLVTLTTQARAKVAAPPAEVAHSPLYGVAMLKIAMELKKADARPLDELVTGVLARMRLDEDEFRAFLELNGGLLRTIAQRRRY